jgi:hypothetical protein
MWQIYGGRHRRFKDLRPRIELPDVRPQDGNLFWTRCVHFGEDKDNGAILARHMPLLNDKLASFINDLGSQRVIDAQQEGSMLSHEERGRL